MQIGAPHRLVPLLVLAGIALACSNANRSEEPRPSRAFREPAPDVVRLLTSPPPPEPIVHGPAGRIALIYREPVIPLEEVARPYLGLAGFRFDPQTRRSGLEAPVVRVEVVDVRSDGIAQRWFPDPPVEHVRFSPDGRFLSAVTTGAGPARLALFDLEAGDERTLDAPINPAWGDPCDWIGNDALLCRIVPSDPAPLPDASPVPVVIEHDGGPAPTRTYSNLLDNAHEDALFEHYFGVDLARVPLEGGMTRIAGPRGLLSNVDPSPDGAFALVTRLEPPYSRFVRANRFPSVLEVWNLERGERLYASAPIGFGVESDPDDEEVRDARWKPGLPTTLGWIETSEIDGVSTDHWLAITEPFDAPIEIARSTQRIRRFAWTTAGTPFFATTDPDEPVSIIHVVFEDGPREVWRGRAANKYENAGRAIRVNGDEGPVVEVGGAFFVASDGLGDDGPRPYLDRFEISTGRTERLYTSDADVFEPVLGVVDPDDPQLITRRETESEPPTLRARKDGSVRVLRSAEHPYPVLAKTKRRFLRYARADGVALSATLYTPPGWSEGDPPLPTLVWIYPYEFSDREHAERLDVRNFRFHVVSGPSPLAAAIEGYAVLVNPKVPILHEGGGTNDEYLPQLVASMDAAVDHLVALGVTDPERVAVGGRSYGAFSSANLLIHSRRFATAIAMSGAYNRTLTPFGFQREKRSFFEAGDLYARVSPFFHADRVSAPILLVHGGSDENPGTPTLQARRFFHALVGEGKPARYVELPGEGHHYLARENVLLAAAEMIDWLDRTIGSERP